MPDGRAIIYENRQGDLVGIWKQPLTGGPPIQLASWKHETGVQREYILSPDGKQWAITRSEALYDVVLISNFK
jgi:hypothetical protein